MSAVDGRLKGILEGDEVARFLAQFVVSDLDRARMKAEDPKANLDALPKNTAQVLKDVKAIWHRRGFNTPAELKAQLIEKYNPDADPKVIQYIRQVESARTSPEATTGYLGKELAYITTGLAHLYARETGKPIAMVEADFSNMGGTNLHFERLLRQDDAVGSESEIKRLAMHLTDRAVALLCKSLTTELRGELPPGARIMPIRTGGDEVRLLVSGVEDAAQMQRLTDLMHANIEKHVAAMGLQDHPHLKAPGDPVRNGFGIALAMQDLREVRNPETLVQELDARIKVAKSDLGMYRLGIFDEEALRAELNQKAARGTLTIPPGQTAEDVIEARVAETAGLAKAASETLHNMNPMYNGDLDGGLAGFDKYVRQTMNQLGPGPLMAADPPDAVTGAKPFGINRPDGVPPLASLQERWNALSQQQLESDGVTLSPIDKYMLNLSVSGLAAKDPSAQTFMPRIVGPTVEAYAAETAEFRKQWKPGKPAVAAALADAGLTSLDEISPQALAVSFHNLAGLNNALGHHQADLVLREMSAGIIEGSLKDAGIPPGPPRPYAIAHHGGGNFSVMIQPGGTAPDGKPWFTSPRRMNQVEELIARRTEEFNRVKITDFLAQNGVTVTADLRRQLAQQNLKTFGDIQDPKLRQIGLATGSVNGLHAVTDSAPLVKRERDGEGLVDGFGFMGRLRDNADAKMDALRDRILIEQVVKAAVSAVSQFNEAAATDTKARPKTKAPKPKVS